MVSVLNKKDDNNLPKGIYPLVIAICPSWQNAQVVDEYIREVIRRVPDCWKFDHYLLLQQPGIDSSQNKK